MSLIKITPKLDTEMARFYEIDGRRLAIVKVDSEVGQEDMENAQSILHQFLDMDVLMLNYEVDIELVEIEGQTWHERISEDE